MNFLVQEFILKVIMNNVVGFHEMLRFPKLSEYSLFGWLRSVNPTYMYFLPSVTLVRPSHNFKIGKSDLIILPMVR